MYHRLFLTMFMFILIENSSVNASVSPEKILNVASPDGNNVIQFILVDGRPMYSVSRAGEMIIDPSAMGFVFKKENSLGKLKLVSADTSSLDETWQQVWG